jgi:UMF1 family MFS transporter
VTRQSAPMAQRSVHSVHLDDAGETRVVTRAPARERWSWALYDFANTIFSMNVLSLFFGAWLVTDLGSSNTLYAISSGLASALVFVSIPVLGAISDTRHARKPWVVGFTLFACAACAAIGILGQETVPLHGEAVIGAGSVGAADIGFSDLKWVLVVFVVANYAYQAAQPFYNAMLAELVPPDEQGRMSGLGVAAGYVGSIVGVLLVTPFFTGDLPIVGPLGEDTLRALRAIPFTEHAGRVSTFVPTALLFLLFSLPFILFCRDHGRGPLDTPVDWRRPFAEIRDTLREARKYPGTLRFIATSFVYQDAVGTIVAFMAVYAVVAVGLDGSSTSTIFLALTVPAIFGSYFYGWLTDRVGPKRALGTTIAVWVVLLLVLAATPGKTAFWMIGIGIGLNFGGVNAVERPMLLSLVPDVHAARFFSLLLLSARAAAVAGPIVWAVIVDSLQAQMGRVAANRLAVAVVGLMFAIAWWLLRRVPDRRPGTPVLG